ncbi:hypothetical protein BRARA_E03458 [Brassica rapa]|uniref:Response regulatory domain-containing protein n=1 Tax=Brassica campestris TaxID=3711 RepID=M4FGH8_BRACM|nr:hypothetical protein BRARA_E03458 [Brassica rapa]
MLLFIPFPYNSIQYIAHIQDKHDQLLLVLSVIVVKCCCSSKSKEEEEEVPAGQVVKKTFKKLCVLVVDDDRSCRSLYMGFIQMRGGFPYMAENGEEAVNLYRDGQTFNLILMDNEMPVMDGVSYDRAVFFSLVRQPRIVGLTSHEDENSGFMEAGADHCLAKPITFENIYLLIEQLKDE